jgi:Phage integrase family
MRRPYSHCMPAPKRHRPRGHIRELPSGSFQVIVYAGTDPLTKKPRYLRETLKTYGAAEVALTRLQGQVDQNRQPKSDITLGQAISRWLDIANDMFLFSPAPDASSPYGPRSLSHRYRRLAMKLGLRSTRLHSLRHYAATELIAAGVDVRTVAGRLGHGSGGATTLKVYAGWVDEADRLISEAVTRGADLQAPCCLLRDKAQAPPSRVVALHLLIEHCGASSARDGARSRRASLPGRLPLKR